MNVKFIENLSDRSASYLHAILGMIALTVWALGCEFKSGESSHAPTQSDIKSQPRSNVRVLLQENRHEIILGCDQPSALTVPLKSANPVTAIFDPEKNSQLYSLLPGVSYQMSRQYGAWTMTRLDNKEWQVFSVARLELRPGPNQAVSLKTNAESTGTALYRGTIQLTPTDSSLFHIINDLDIEDYLLGVVGSEAYSHWEIAALRAQCVASRTYALYWLNLRDKTSLYDVRATQASQMYKGIGAENARIAQVTQDTTGIVLAYGPAGKEKLFPAYYSAICGGHTQNARQVFGDSLKPLSGVSCPYCEKIAPQDLFTWKDVRIPKQKVAELLIDNYPFLQDLIKIVNIQIAAANEQGRIQSFNLTGLEGRTMRLRAEDLRLTVDPTGRAVQSCWFNFQDLGDSWGFTNGRGWGHGVGMCQWGAQQMALQGSNSVDILKHYYPGAILVRAY